MFDVRGRGCLVTGGARGFGREFAARLLRSGAGGVCITDVDEEEGRRAEEELRKEGAAGSNQRVFFVRCDVRSEEDFRRAWEEAESGSGLGLRVTLLVNNAGVNPEGGWRRCVDVCFMGVAVGTYLALEKMDKTKGGEGGRVVNVASYAGILTGLGDMQSASYTAAKWGVVGLTRSFDRKVERRTGVKGFALCPWFAQTKLVTDAIEISKLERLTKHRVLRVEEVGEAFEEALKLDNTGSCFGIFPDAPLMHIPDPNVPAFAAFLLASKVLNRFGFGSPSSGLVLDWRVASLVCLLLLAAVVMALRLAAMALW